MWCIALFAVFVIIDGIEAKGCPRPEPEITCKSGIFQDFKDGTGTSHNYDLTTQPSNITDCSDNFDSALIGDRPLTLEVNYKLYFVELSTSPSLWFQRKCLAQGVSAIKFNGEWKEETTNTYCHYSDTYATLSAKAAQEPEKYMKWTPELVA